MIYINLFILHAKIFKKLFKIIHIQKAFNFSRLQYLLCMNKHLPFPETLSITYEKYVFSSRATQNIILYDKVHFLESMLKKLFERISWVTSLISMWPSGKLEIKRLSSQRVKAVYGAGFVFGSDLKKKNNCNTIAILTVHV